MSEPEPDSPDRNSISQEIDAASARCFGTFAPQAMRYAMSIMQSWSDAEEVVQEAFCRLIESGKWNPSRSADDAGESALNSKAVLFATVRNLSIDRVRQQGRRRFEAFDVCQLSTTENNSDEARLEQLENGVQAGLKTMPTEWADAIQLRMNGDLSYQAIAQILGATHGQVRTWIYRARKQLAKDLNRQGLLDEANDNA